MVELYDDGGGLPYLGSQASYNAGDWENTLRAYHDGPDHTYDKQIAQIDAIALAVLQRQAHARATKAAVARRRPHHRHHGHDHGHQAKKLAIVLDIDETGAVELLGDRGRQLQVRHQLDGGGHR